MKWLILGGLCVALSIGAVLNAAAALSYITAGDFRPSCGCCNCRPCLCEPYCDCCGCDGCKCGR